MNFEESLVKAQTAFTDSDYQLAEGYYLQSLNEAILVHGHYNSAVIIVCLNYADFLSQLDRYDEARPMIQRACAVATHLRLMTGEANHQPLPAAAKKQSLVLFPVTSYCPDVESPLADR